MANPRPFVDAGSGDGTGQTDVDITTQNATWRSLAASFAAATAVRERRFKRKRSSQSDSAAGAEHMSEKEPSLDDFYKSEQLCHLVNPENRALIGAGETLDEWIIGHGKWPGER